MKKILFLLLLIPFFVFTGCGFSKGPCDVFDTNVEITYKNTEGLDLLNLSTPNHFSADSMHLYNVVNGVKNEVYNGHYDNPRNFVIELNNGTHIYYLAVSLEADTTLLQLNGHITDTITCDFSAGCNKIVNKVWYNGKLEWDNMSEPRAFTIIK
ncbi:MAG: hypothetical protein IH595_12770 [Bacteroidales bacterium]|nr:hypothetical protein [Bacteroidales bacterium]